MEIKLKGVREVESGLFARRMRKFSCMTYGTYFSRMKLVASIFNWDIVQHVIPIVVVRLCANELHNLFS